MIPHERSLLKKLKNRPFAVVGVNSDSPEKLKELVAKGKVTWRNFVNVQKDGKISERWSVNAWPTIYLIDHKGVIRYKGLRAELLDAAIMKLVRKAEEEKK